MVRLDKLKCRGYLSTGCSDMYEISRLSVLLQENFSRDHRDPCARKDVVSLSSLTMGTLSSNNGHSQY